MPVDGPHASWHPALMPNVAEPRTQSLPPPSTEVLENQVDGASQLVADSLEPREDALEKSGLDAWFPEYETETGDNWLADAGDAEAAPNEAAETTEATETAEQEEESQPESTNATKHLSTMSFARTVSHEVNWTDDEDVETSLPRTDTDPFKFMPPTDRTNSFPVVPPLNQPEGDAEEQPLAADQPEGVGQVDEQDHAHVDSRPDFGSAFQEDEGFLEDDEIDEMDADTSHQYVGGELHGTSEEASEARFAEGLPLIPRDQEEGKGKPKRTDPFAAEPAADEDDFFSQLRKPAAEEDDFFSQLRDTADSEPQPFEPPALERKSTAQVMNGLDMGDQVSNIPTVDEAEEEDELFPSTTDTPAAPVEAALEPAEQAQTAEGGEDLDAKWKAMFSGEDDDDLLLDDTEDAPKEVDPTAFLGSDDEGFLEDEDEQPTPQAVQTAPAPAPAPASQPTRSAPNGSAAPNNRYVPANQTASSVAPPSNPYLAQAPNFAPIQAPVTAAVPTPLAQQPFGAAQYGSIPPQPQPDPSKAQSFAAKAKGGYTSPYDLPMEVVKPRKRVSMQNLQRPSAAPAPPPGPPAPRSTSMYNQPPPRTSSTTSLPPSSLGPGQAAGPPPAANSMPPPPLASKSRESFFEELPMSAKPRPTSRHSNKSLPSPSQTSPHPPPASHPPPPQTAPPPAAQYAPVQPPPTTIAQLVPPERVNPYATPQAAPAAVPSMPPPTTSNRYSPAPTSLPNPTAAVPPAANTRYSPAPPPSSRSPGTASYPPGQGNGTAPSILPHQPRTSSPLAQFEVSHDRARPSSTGHGEPGPVDRRSSAGYESRIQRVPSLPPTREVEEEEGQPQLQAPPQAPQQQGPPPSRGRGRPDSGYGQSPYQPAQTPQPPPPSSHLSFSPPKRAVSNYSPARDFAPPPRSQTQSPGARYSQRASINPVEPVQRPSSVHEPTSPRMTQPAAASMQQVLAPAMPSSAAPRSRGPSQNFNLIPPTDGREHDPLERWKGVPLITWGLGGTIVTMFPKDVPRYGMNQSVPMIVRSPGEIKVSNIKDIQPLEERLAKFPGPLKGKSNKKETLAWLSSGIEGLEASIPHHLASQTQSSHEDKRARERVLLWKILRLFVEHDGSLDGNPAVEEGVRAVLSPNLGGQGLNGSPGYATIGNLAAQSSGPVAQMHSDGVDPSAIEEIRNHLLVGAREKAVWVAADKRLWGHALLIANTVSPDLYKQVTQEFVKKEVNYPGHNNESLATLYEVLSGNHEECVDELVPVHARAGLQLVAKDAPTMGSSKGALDGLDKWQETLGLILSNRSKDDTRALNSLGNLLASYGRAEAAHICFIFARNHTVFGGIDDPASNFVLVGSDHKGQAEQFAKEIEPLLLSEVYEYGLSLAGGSNVGVNSPHLAAYKLQHALTLAEYGYRQKALQYCDAITNAITSQTRRSPYHHVLLELAVDDLTKRLKQSPKEESNSWIAKPSMNKVSDSVWDKFNKFVAGDENENSGQRSPTEGVESGPFARVMGGTPTISRPPSSSGYDAAQAGGIPGYPMTNGPLAASISAPSLPQSRAASRYAPAPSQSAGAAPSPYDPNNAYAPHPSMERHSGEINRASFDNPRRSSDMPTGPSNAYMPNSGPAPQSYQPNYAPGASTLSRESSYLPVSPPEEQVPQPPAPSASAIPGYQPYGNAGPVSNGSPYEPPRPDSAEYSSGAGNSKALTPESQPSQTPSYGYEPPSFTPYEAPQEKEEQPTEESGATTGGGGYEAPSYQPYGYEPPSYEPDLQPQAEEESDSESKPKPKKRGVMYDDDDDDIGFSQPKSQEKTREEKDRENAEMFRKAAEEDAKRAAEAKQAKKGGGWGFGGWFGGAAAKKDSAQPSPNKPIRAKLGEENSFVYDPEKKRWINKKGNAEDNAPKTATPPPPKGPPRSAASTPPPTSAPGLGRSSAPPGGPAGPPSRGSTTSSPPSALSGTPAVAAASDGSTGKLTPAPPAMMRTVSNTSSAAGQPPKSLSTASSIDDLLSVGPRSKGPKKARKSGRYVDVMAK